MPTAQPNPDPGRVTIAWLGWQDTPWGPLGLWNVLASPDPKLVPGSTVTLQRIRSLGLRPRAIAPCRPTLPN